MSELSLYQSRLSVALMEAGYATDVAIGNLYDKVWQSSVVMPDRYMQQRLGALISRFNKRMKDENRPTRIVPGKLKRTYRIVVTNAE